MLKRTAVEAYGSLQTLQPFAAFRDAASGIQCFDLTVKSVVEVCAALGKHEYCPLSLGKPQTALTCIFSCFHQQLLIERVPSYMVDDR